MSNTTIVSGYDPFDFQEEVSEVIRIEGSPPPFHANSAEEYNQVMRWYRDQATLIHDVLKNSLPGGTKHQLLILMLEDKQDLLRVKEIRDD